jgi:ribosome-associated protein
MLVQRVDDRGLSTEEVTEHLLSRATWSASRSSGPGGQHRDKASTRAELTVTAESLTGLDPELAAHLARALGLLERPLRIAIQDERSLVRNQDIAARRLADLVAEALDPPPPPRRATRPSRSAREARLADKARRGGLKRQRRPERHHDE